MHLVHLVFAQQSTGHCHRFLLLQQTRDTDSVFMKRADHRHWGTFSALFEKCGGFLTSPRRLGQRFEREKKKRSERASE